MEIRIRKLISIILCFCLCITSFSVDAKSKKTSGKDGKNIVWSYDKTTKTLTFSGKGPISDFEMDGHSAEPEWYDWSEEAETIIVEEGITTIGDGGFQDFWKVKEVFLPETVRMVKFASFWDNKNLRNCNMPGNIEIIGSHAFFSCTKLKTFIFSKKVKKIGSYAFSGCENIKEFIFPSKVKKIEKGVLGECKSLTKVKLPEKAKDIPEYAFAYCPRLEKINIPANVKKVTMSAFVGTGLKKLILPRNVQEIRNGSHGNNGLGSGVEMKKLRVIEIRSSKVHKIQKKSFCGISHKVVIKVPRSKKKKYTKMLRKSGLSKKIRIKTLSM